MLELQSAAHAEVCSTEGHQASAWQMLLLLSLLDSSCFTPLDYSTYSLRLREFICGQLSLKDPFPFSFRQKGKEPKTLTCETTCKSLCAFRTSSTWSSQINTLPAKWRRFWMNVDSRAGPHMYKGCWRVNTWSCDVCPLQKCTSRSIKS